MSHLTHLIQPTYLPKGPPHLPKVPLPQLWYPPEVSPVHDGLQGVHGEHAVGQVSHVGAVGPLLHLRVGEEVEGGGGEQVVDAAMGG